MSKKDCSSPVACCDRPKTDLSSLWAGGRGGHDVDVAGGHAGAAGHAGDVAGVHADGRTRGGMLLRSV